MPVPVPPEVTVGASVASRAAGIVGHPGESEVEDLHRSVRADPDVRRLQIAVDDSDSVRRLETGRDLRGDAEGLVERQRPSRQPLLEPFPLDQLEDEVNGAPRLFDAVKGRDVRVIQRAEEAGLALEAGPALRVAREGVRKGLDRDLAVEPRVARPKDLTHPPSPERREDFERPDTRTGRKRHWLRSASTENDRGLAGAKYAPARRPETVYRSQPAGSTEARLSRISK